MNTHFTLLAAACALALVACANKPSSTTSETAAPATEAAAPATESAPAETAAPTPVSAEPAPTETAPAAAMPKPASAAPTPTPTPTPTPAPTPAATAPAPAPAAPPAVAAADCATEIAATDTMQYSVKSITVPASCTEFKITLKHTGKLPVVAMGHNVVITKFADMQAVATEGMGAGAKNDYVKPGDPRVIAHTKLVGGGQTASVSFPVSKITGNGPYEFFCSFPGHSAIMKGTIAVK